jgi:hypothetical protein
MAADLTQTFMGKHGEKVAVGVAGLILVGAVAWFVVMREPHDDLRIEANRLVTQLENKVQQEVELREVLEPDERTALGIGRQGTTVADLREAVTGLPQDYEVAMTWVSPVYKKEKGPPPDKEHYAPDEILPVEEVEVAVAYGVTDAVDVPNPQATLQTAEATYHDVVWAGVVGKFDLTRQVEIIQKPYLAKNRTAPLLADCPVTVSRLDVQRRQINPDGTTTDWEPITPTVPPEVAAAMPARPADNAEAAAGIEWGLTLMDMQAQIRRLPFFNILTLGVGQTVQDLLGDVPPVSHPDLSRFTAKAAPAAPAAETVAAAPAEVAETETTPSEAVDSGSPFRRRTRPRERPTEKPTDTTEAAEREHVFATLWAHDATVKPGNTYQYRMRTAILNPVYSLQNVQPEAARFQLEFEGPWSEPSAPVTVPELAEFYFVGTFGDRINLELHKWVHGQWIIVPSAPTYLGAPVVYTKTRARIAVPGTGETVEKDVEIAPGAFLVDLVRQFPYQPKGGTRPINANVLMYADDEGNLRRRIDWEDQEQSRDDRTRRKEAAAAAAAAGGGGRRRRR